MITKSKIFKELLEKENINTDGIISEKNRLLQRKKELFLKNIFPETTISTILELMMKLLKILKTRKHSYL